MMKNVIRLLCLLMALLLSLPLALAETEDPVIATVNGEPLYYSEYAPIESAYLYQYQMAGVDLTDPEVCAYVQDQALSYAIEQKLIEQDMAAQGCYELTEDLEIWCQEMGQLAWEEALDDVCEMLRDTLELTGDEDLTEYALDYASNLGVTAQSYVDEYRAQLARMNYYDWLLGGAEVTEADVQTAYEARVADSRARYEQDVPAFENAVANGAEVWYMPEGYRRVLQILLPAEGATNEERLAAAQTTVAEIDARLNAGESFASLIAEYGIDANFNDEAFYHIGYQVHRDSVMWEDAFVAAAFSAEMTAPGCWSQPFASEMGVHILYYLDDVPGGAVELTSEVYDMLAYVLYDGMTQTALAERIDVLAAEAEVVLH